MNLKCLVTLARFICLITASTAQSTAQSTARYATTRIIEGNSDANSRIVTVFENGKSEIIPLKSWGIYQTGSAMQNNLIENQKSINKFFNDMNAKGYEIKTMTTTGEKFFITLVVFSRKEE